MIVEYKTDRQLQLWVKDTGSLDEFALFINGTLRMKIADQLVHKFPIDRPTDSAAVAVHFEGVDGGKTAVVDVTDGGQKPVGSQDGLIHSYILKGV